MGQPFSQIAKRLWALAKESGHSSPAANEPSASRQHYVVYYDEELNIVQKEWATYELHLQASFLWEWRVVGGSQDERATFHGGGRSDWSEEEWAQFPYNIISGPIKEGARNPKSDCGFAFRWINSDWHARYRMFLGTHRGSLDSCEQIFIWLAYAFAPTDRDFPRASWTILIKQPHDQVPEPFLWSHIKRDCTLFFNEQPVEFSDQQFKLARLAHCYFMPFYSETMRRSYSSVYEWEKEAAWRFDVPSPSQHERLEARLNLREWLKNKLSAAEIDSLLGC